MPNAFIIITLSFAFTTVISVGVMLKLKWPKKVVFIIPLCGAAVGSIPGCLNVAGHGNVLSYLGGMTLGLFIGYAISCAVYWRYLTK